jgi:mono/diheme cytochrome c family protein
MLDKMRSRVIWLGLVFTLILALKVWTPSIAQTSGDMVEKGAALYLENCAVCHGATGEGRIGATLAKDWPSIRPDLRVKTTIENGITGTRMPAWSQAKGGPLSDEEIEALVLYILSWQTGGLVPTPLQPSVTSRPPITPPPEVTGDPNRGAVLFDKNCAVCHGPEGKGRIGANLSDAWSSIRADLQVKTRISNGIDGTFMPAWSQASGGPLSEQEIDDLTAFVLSLSQNPPPQSVTTPAHEATPPIAAILISAVCLLLFAIAVVLVLLVQRNRTQKI